MMKNLILIAVLIGFQLILPWWSLIFPCMLYGFLIKEKSRKIFLEGFCFIFFLWLIASLIFEFQSNGKISSQITTLFSLPNKYILFIISSIIGGLVGGVACLSGYYISSLRSWAKPRLPSN